MCGIAGIYNLRGKQVLRQDLDILVDALDHRGPDGRGVWIENNVGLGHLRLAILDLSDNGKQPMSYDNGRYWITLNGEIYNFIEIRNTLESEGYKFTSQSDTEVILAAYKKWHEKMLDKFNGMWAFAIFDTKKHTLFLSRDRFGVKPLYYYIDSERFVFASEVQAIHKLLGIDHQLNKKVIMDIASGSFNNHGTDQTYLQNVFALPGGYNLLVHGNKGKLIKWYELNRVKVHDKFTDQAVHLRELIKDACLLRLRSDVPIGTCLSGGVDSSSISAVIDKFNETNTRFTKYTHKAFCAGFPETPIDESKKAKLLAKKLQIKLDIVDIKAPTEKELVDAMKQCDGPMHALAFYPIWSLYKYIKNQKVTVTLDGQGPDEMLGGYNPLYEALTAAIELKKPGWFVDLYRTYSMQGETKQFSSWRHSLKILTFVLFKKFIIFDVNILASLGFLRPKKELALRMNHNVFKFQYIRKPIKFSNTLDKSLYNQFFQTPLPGILNQYDRCSMAHGIECRMPFMDYRIVEYVFSLPPQSKVGGGYTKRVLREAMKGIVPSEILFNKTKLGFNAPIVDWFKGPLKDFMYKQMSTPTFINSTYFNGVEIKKSFDKFINNPHAQWEEAWKFWPPVHLAWWINYNREVSKWRHQ